MRKINLENNTYFIGEDDSVYMVMHNIIEFIDKDNLKRYVLQLKDKDRILKVKEADTKECKKENLFDVKENIGFVNFLKFELFEIFFNFVEVENENEAKKMSPFEFFQDEKMFEYFKDIVIRLDKTENIIKKLKLKYEAQKNPPIEILFGDTL